MEVINFEDNTLNDHTEKFYITNLIKDIILDDIIDEVKEYFPEKAIKSFEIFKPAKIPTNPAESLRYGVAEIMDLCLFFKWDNCKENVVEDWSKMIRSIIDNPTFCEMR